MEIQWPRPITDDQVARAPRPLTMPMTMAEEWGRAYRDGRIRFDPRQPGAMREQQIGRFVKRFIPGRSPVAIRGGFGPSTPVQVPMTEDGFHFSQLLPAMQMAPVIIRGVKWDVVAAQAPLGYHHHSLLVPEERRSQFITASDFMAVGELLRVYRQMTATFSSLAAGASVNEQHTHLFSDAEPFPAAAASRVRLWQRGGVSVDQLVDWPSDSFILRGSPHRTAAIAADFVRELQRGDVPHNIVWGRGEVWIAPRTRRVLDLPLGLKLGAPEVVMGTINTSTEAAHQLVDEAMVLGALEAIRFPSTERKHFADALIAVAQRSVTLASER